MVRAVASLLCLLLLGTAAVSHAAFYIVRKTQDTNDGVCDGDCSLREAIVAANAHPGMDYVTLPAGQFTLTIPGAGEDACATGDLDITDAVAISGQSPADSVVNANGLGDRVFHVKADGLTVLLGGLTMTGGYTTANGGGAYHEAGILILSNVVVSGNQTTMDGGGVYSDLAQLTVQDGSVISDNSAGIDWPYRGGGLCAGNLTVTDSTISGNQAYNGAGIATGGALTVSGSTIAYNTATGMHGGGIEASVGLFDVTNSTVVGNSALNGGGFALFNLGGTPSVHSVTLSGNSGYGSAIEAFQSSISFTNTVVSGDCYLAAGGAIVSNGGNLESPGNTCTLTGPGDQVTVADPKLASLAANGGLTQTLLPQLNSPAVDNGSNAYCLSVDQRGEPRSDGACDVGAVERQAADPLFVDGFESGGSTQWSSTVT